MTWNAAQVYGGLGLPGLEVGLGSPPRLALPRYVQEILSDRPVSYYRLNDLGGARLTDEMNLQHGTLTGGVTYLSGGPLAEGGVGMLFNGSTGFGEATASWDPSGVKPFGIEALVKPAVVDATFRRVGGREPTANHGVYLYWQNGGFGVLRGDSGAVTDAATGVVPVAGRWFHLLGTYDGTTLTLYVNGVVAGFIASSRSADATGNLRVGGTVNVTNGNATIAEYALYGYCPTPAAVARHLRLFQRAFPLPDLPLLAQPYIAKVYTNGLQFKKTLGLSSARALVGDKPGLKATINSGQHPVSLHVVAQQPPRNQVVDPGFEASDVIADVQASWSLTTPSEWSLQTTPSDLAEGRRAIKCTRTILGPNNWNVCAQLVRLPVVPGATYTASAWSKQNTGTKQTHMKLDFFDAAGNGYAGTQFMAGTDGPRAWTFYSGSAVAPPQAVAAQVSLEAGWWNGVSGVDTQSWFDDVRLVRGTATDDPVENGDVIQLTEQGDPSGTILYTGVVEEIPDETSESDEIHELSLMPLIAELGDTYFNKQYLALTDVAQMVRDAVNATGHLRVQPETCGDTGIKAVADFTDSNALEVLTTAKRIAGVNFWWFVDATGLVWFQSATPTNPALITLTRGFDYASWKRSRSIQYLKNKIRAIGGFPTGSTSAIVSSYSNLVSQKKYGVRAMDPPLIYPGITDQATLDLIVATLGAALDRERSTYEVEIPNLGMRLTPGVSGGLTVRLLDHAADQVAQPMQQSGGYLGPYVGQDVEIDGVKQTLILGDVPLASVDDLKYEIDRIIQRLGVAAIAPATKVAGDLGAIVTSNPGSPIADEHGLLGSAIKSALISGGTQPTGPLAGKASPPLGLGGVGGEVVLCVGQLVLSRAGTVELVAICTDFVTCTSAFTTAAPVYFQIDGVNYSDAYGEIPVFASGDAGARAATTTFLKVMALAAGTHDVKIIWNSQESANDTCFNTLNALFAFLIGS